MTETPKEAARRFSRTAIADGFEPKGLHEYTNAQGETDHYRIRLKHPSFVSLPKEIQERYNGSDKWIRPFHLNGRGFEMGEPKRMGRKPIYLLHRIASHPDAVVWIVEGEQKADALYKLGLLATTSGAATSADAADWQPLRGRTVRIWPDNDDPGKAYAGGVASFTLGMGCAVSCVDVDKLGLGIGEDVVEWLAAHPGATGGDVEALPMLTPSPAVANPDTAQLVTRCFSDIAPKPINWLWPDRIARGKLTVIAGDPGLGKSQLTASLAAIVTRGGTWPVDRTPCERGRVIFLSAEDDPADTIRPRLDATGADVSLCEVIQFVQLLAKDGTGRTRRAFSLKDDMDRLSELLAKRGDVALVIIDPVTAYMGDTDTHRNSDVRAILAEVSEVAGQHKAAFIAISHLNKGDSSKALQRVTGSLAFVAAARAAFLVAEDKNTEGQRLFVPMKNNIGPDATGYAYRIEEAEIAGGIKTSRISWGSECVTVTADDALSPEPEAGEKGELEAAKEFLLTELAKGAVSAKEIEKDAVGNGHSMRTIYRAKKELGIESDKGGMAGGWQWKLPKIAKNGEDCQAGNVATFGEIGNLRQPSAGATAIVEVEV